VEEESKEPKKSLFDLSMDKFTANLEKPVEFLPKLSLNNIGKGMNLNFGEEIKNDSNPGSSLTDFQTPQFKFFENSKFKELTICGDCFSTNEYSNFICKKCTVLNSLQPFSKYIFILNTNLQMERRFIEILSNEIYFYENELKTECLQILLLSSVIVTERRIFIFDNQKEFYPIEFNYNSYSEKIFLEKVEDRKELLGIISKEVNLKNFSTYYQIIQYIGGGKDSQVYKVFHKETKKEYAAKFIKKNDIELDQIELMRNEIDILKILKHPNIINIVESFEEENFLYIILEFLNEGELEKYWKKNNKRIPEEQMKPIVHSIASSLYFMKQLGIIHRDLKPMNIMRNKCFPISNIKIVDYGLSKIFSPNCKCNDSYGTLVFVAHEVLLGNNYDYSIDVWSLGVILCYMITGQLPFDDEIDDNISIKICYCQPNIIRNSPDIQLSGEVIELIERMLDKNPLTRIKLEEILTNNWVINGNEELKTLRLTAPDSQKFRLFSIADPDNINSFMEGLH